MHRRFLLPATDQGYQTVCVSKKTAQGYWGKNITWRHLLQHNSWARLKQEQRLVRLTSQQLVTALAESHLPPSYSTSDLWPPLSSLSRSPLSRRIKNELIGSSTAKLWQYFSEFRNCLLNLLSHSLCTSYVFVGNSAPEWHGRRAAEARVPCIATGDLSHPCGKRAFLLLGLYNSFLISFYKKPFQEWMVKLQPMSNSWYENYCG